jgi:hypothetical protein
MAMGIVSLVLFTNSAGFIVVLRYFKGENCIIEHFVGCVDR